jgi:hypothetical protein
MHLAAENFFSPGAIFRRRNDFFDRLQAPRSELAEIDEPGGTKPQRFKNPVLTEAVEGIPGKNLYGLA